MEHNRQIKILSIVALVIAIVAMSLGFAAFSATLNISSSASVSPNSSDFKIRIVSYDGSNIIEPISFANASGSNATIGEDGLTLSNISVNLSEPGSCVVYRFYVQNDSPYDAYLSSYERVDTDGDGNNKKCVAESDNVNDELLLLACESISYGFDLYDVDGTKVTDNPVGQVLHPGEQHTIDFKVVYLDDGTLADGDFRVDFDDIKIEYSTSNLITFTIDRTEYHAEVGMTWEEWVNSSYNTDGFELSNNVIVASDKDFYIFYSDYFTYVDKNSIISSTEKYCTLMTPL